MKPSETWGRMPCKILSGDFYQLPPISEEAWQALKATVIRTSGTDPRLSNARGWYECAYEWRIVSCVMHAHARLNAKAAGRMLFYIPAIDVQPPA